MSRFAILILGALATAHLGCDDALNSVRTPRRFIQRIECVVDEGILSDDLKFFNASKRNLTELHLQITVLGVKGDSKTHARYFASWPADEMKLVNLSSAESVHDIQKVELKGECGEGILDLYWLPKATRP